MFSIEILRFSFEILGISKICDNHLPCFILGSLFLPFYPPVGPENQNFEKIKQTHGDIIILKNVYHK